MKKNLQVENLIHVGALLSRTADILCQTGTMTERDKETMRECVEEWGYSLADYRKVRGRLRARCLIKEKAKP
jgi:hypothetical protein